MTMTPPTPTPAQAAAARDRAAWVARWLLGVMAERDGVWLQSELLNRAWQDNVNFLAWYNHPVIRATGIRTASLEMSPGVNGLFFVLSPAEASPEDRRGV